MALITCKECGAQISEFAEVCPSCGAPTAISKAPPAVEQPQYQSYQQSQQQVDDTQQSSPATSELPPKSWLVESILVTILCCPPFGIAGIVNAAKVESRWYAGDKAAAKRASDEAGRWTKIGFFGGLVISVVYILLAVLGAIHGFWESGSYYY